MIQHSFIPLCIHVYACAHTHSIYTQNMSSFINELLKSTLEIKKIIFLEVDEQLNYEI